MKSIIGVVIGGLCAAPIAQFVLWYLPGNWDVEQRDPMSIGRKLDGTFASFLVPASVKNPGGGNAVANDTPETDPPSNENNTDLANQLPDPDEETGGLGSLLGTSDGTPDNGNEDEPDVPIFDPLAGDGNDGSDVPGTGGDTTPPPQAESVVRNAPSFTSAELGEELKVVQEEVKRFDDVTNAALDGGARLAIRDDFFAAVGKLAEATTFVEKRSAGVGDFLDEILGDAGNTAQKRKVIGTSALGIIKNEGRDTDGIILSGTVREINKRGQLFETVIEVHATDNPPISVYGEKDPRDALEAGDAVMVLGVIIDKPVDELRGYKGPRDDAVIWGGYSKVINVDE